jgi:NADH-quinone oxidoreductase subunit C
VEIAKKLKALGFDHVKAVTGIDFIEENKIDIVYHVSSFNDPELAKVILILRTTLNRSEPKIPSLREVWPSAEYPEKETAELMGVTFKGLIMDGRFMLPEDFEGIPLRKDFKIKTEGIDA